MFRSLCHLLLDRGELNPLRVSTRKGLLKVVSHVKDLSFRRNASRAISVTNFSKTNASTCVQLVEIRELGKLAVLTRYTQKMTAKNVGNVYRVVPFASATNPVMSVKTKCIS